MENLVILFRNKFFKLYETKEFILEQTDDYIRYCTRYNFVKNISKDKVKAFEKYPDAEFNETLGEYRGGSFNTFRYEWLNNKSFRFGKYIKQRIDDTNDINYISWYYGQIDGEHKEYVASILKKWGIEIETTSVKIGKKKITTTCLIDTNQIKKNEILDKKYHSLLDSKENGTILYLNATHNPNENGFYRDGDVLYKFEKVKYNYYNGIEYFLPVLNNQAKRIKNKKLAIDNYNVTRDNKGNVIIEINNFKIEK